MTDIEWQPLPPLWPAPAVWTDVGDLMLLVYTQDGVPTWEVSRRAKSRNRDELIANGTADTFAAAKAAALFEARAQSPVTREDRAGLVWCLSIDFTNGEHRAHGSCRHRSAHS